MKKKKKVIFMELGFEFKICNMLIKSFFIDVYFRLSNRVFIIDIWGGY